MNKAKEEALKMLKKDKVEKEEQKLALGFAPDGKNKIEVSEKNTELTEKLVIGSFAFFLGLVSPLTILFAMDKSGAYLVGFLVGVPTISLLLYQALIPNAEQIKATLKNLGDSNTNNHSIFQKNHANELLTSPKYSNLPSNVYYRSHNN